MTTACRNGGIVEHAGLPGYANNPRHAGGQPWLDIAQPSETRHVSIQPQTRGKSGIKTPVAMAQIHWVVDLRRDDIRNRLALDEGRQARVVGLRMPIRQQHRNGCWATNIAAIWVI